MSEIRLAIRRVMSRRAAMAVSVLTLAVAVGAGAATSSVLSAVLLNPLPVRDPERLAMVGAVQNAGPGRIVPSGLTYPHYPQVAASGVFASMDAVWRSPVSLPVGSQKLPESTPVMFVSGTFFDVLGVPISLGRAVTAVDDRRGAPVVAVLSDAYWRATVDADPDSTLDDKRHTIDLTARERTRP